MDAWYAHGHMMSKWKSTARISGSSAPAKSGIVRSGQQSGEGCYQRGGCALRRQALPMSEPVPGMMRAQHFNRRQDHVPVGGQLRCEQLTKLALQEVSVAVK